MSTLAYKELRRKVIFDALEKFPDTPSKTIARMLKRDNPELFTDIEDARGQIRIYRGTHGEWNRKTVKVTKYYKNV